MKKYAIGVDIGGSHISCALVDINQGILIGTSRNEADVNNKANADTILNSWANVILKTMSSISQDDLAGIGFGMPGPFDYVAGIARFVNNDKYESLNGVNVAFKLKNKLGLDESTPLRFMNDASAFAVGEAWLGCARKAEKSVSITLGTGFGSAFVNNGIPVVDGDVVPELGCVWHLPFADGIADDYFSTRWFVKRYKEETGITVSGAKHIAKTVSSNPKAADIFEEYGNNMGDFFAPWLKLFGAQVLVVGGNITGAYNLFGPAFESAMHRHSVDTRIEISSLKEDAAIIGSARLLNNDFWMKMQPIVAKM